MGLRVIHLFFGALYLLGASIVLGFPITTSVTFAVFFSLNAYCGSYVWKVVTKQVSVPFIESVGAGIALGTLLPAIINSIVRTVGIVGASTAWMFPLIILVFRFLDQRRLIGRSTHATSEDFRVISWLAVLPWFGILAWGVSVLPFCLVGLSGLLVDSWMKDRIGVKDKKIRSFVMPSIILVSGAITQIVVDNIRSAKPVWQQFYAVDTVIDESVSWGISKYGMSENVLDLGTRTYQHVLTHSWAGDVSSFLGETRFMASGVLGFLVGLVGIAFLLFAMARRIGVSNNGSIFVIGVFFLQASMPDELTFVGPRMANSISMLWFLLLVMYTISLIERRRFNHLSLAQLLVVPITMGKAHWGLLYVFCLFPTLIISRSFSIVRSVLILMMGSAGFIATYVIVIGGAGSDHATNSITTISFGVGLIPLLLSFMALRLYPLLVTPRDNANAVKDIYRIFALSSTMLLPVVWLTDGGFLSSYFLYPILLISAPFAGSEIDRVLNSGQIKKAEVCLFIVSVLFGASTLLAYLYSNYRFIDSGRNDLISTLIVDYPELITVLGFFCALLLLIILNRMLSRKIPGKRVVDLARYGLMMSVGISLGVYIVQTQRNHLMKSFYGETVAMKQVVSDSQVTVGNWLKENVPHNELIATNYFCTNLLREDVSFDRGDTDCFTRNSLPWISAISHRRMLIEAPLFVAGRVFSDDQYDRYRGSIFLGSILDRDSLQSLLNRGVQWFVVDKTQTVMRNFYSIGSTQFSYGEFDVIQLINSDN